MFRQFKVLLLFSFLFTGAYSQTGGSLLSEDFNAYNGTSATVPPGWNFSYNGNYTSTSFSGATGPSAYKFGINNAAITSPVFSNPDSIRFWMKGAGADTISYLDLIESPDSVNWTLVKRIKPVSNSGVVVHEALQQGTKYIRFVYSKSAGNVALDDLEIFSTPSNPNGLILAYFNHPVNTTVSIGQPAIYLNQTMDDTLVAYINRAQYTLDIAVYNFIQANPMADVALAINNAYQRGVIIRWIYDGGSGNSGLNLLNPAIQKLGSPVTSGYGLMHNKFMIIDAGSPNTNDAWVWTGSANWVSQQFMSDYNNVVIIRDKQLALAYTREFNQMWGSAGPLPNSTNSRMGPNKIENNIHEFNVNGRKVELYFSPSQNTNAHILSSINSASYDLYFGTFAFTLDADAAAIKAVKQSGVFTAGIMDQFCLSYTPYDTLLPVLGNNLLVYSQSFLYHNKLLIADQGDTLSDPLVLTGSHNWTSSADTKNDENTLIIHDPFIANQFYQSFYADFTGMGGWLGVDESRELRLRFTLFPNPSGGSCLLRMEQTEDVTIMICSMEGRSVRSYEGTGALFSLDVQDLPDGIYLVKVTASGWISTGKLIVAGD